MKLNQTEILRYLGYKRQQTLRPEMRQLIEDVSNEVQQISQPRYTFQIFELEVTNETIVVPQAGVVLPGRSVYKHLQHAQKIALLGVTLGIAIERQIRRYEATDLTRAVILDACCTEYIEKIADLAECDIEQQADGLTLNRRFSPGYGDLPLTVQPQLLHALAAERQLGITLNENLLMIPRKSITAFTGLFADEKMARPRRQRPNCVDCDLTTCPYRVGGKK